jgi:hypothetical protein
MSALDLVTWYKLHQNRGDEMKKKAGNATWNYLHTLAEWTMPTEPQQRKAYNALRAAIVAFPCEQCSNHGVKYLNNNPYLPSKESFKEYVWRFHNAVNKNLGKPEVPLPDEYSSTITVESFSNMNDQETVEALGVEA